MFSFPEGFCPVAFCDVATQFLAGSPLLLLAFPCLWQTWVPIVMREKYELLKSLFLDLMKELIIES